MNMRGLGGPAPQRHTGKNAQLFVKMPSGKWRSENLAGTRTFSARRTLLSSRLFPFLVAVWGMYAFVLGQLIKIKQGEKT
jgi:hypothetical protein